MTREVYVLEEYDHVEDAWYPVASAHTRYEVEYIHARWPDTTANPKRIVTYGPKDRTACTWTEDEDGTWHTGCGNACQFTDGGPTENKVKFCYQCGQLVVAAVYGPKEETPA